MSGGGLVMTIQLFYVWTIFPVPYSGLYDQNVEELLFSYRPGNQEKNANKKWVFKLEAVCPFPIQFAYLTIHSIQILPMKTNIVEIQSSKFADI